MQRDVEKLIEPLRQQFQESMSGWLEGQGSEFSERLGHISSAIDKMAEELESQQEEELANLARSGSHGLGELASKLKGSDPKEVLRAIEEQGHEHPAGAFIASLAAGFLTTRVAKHTAHHQEAGLGSDLEATEPSELDAGSSSQAVPPEEFAAGSTGIESEPFESGEFQSGEAPGVPPQEVSPEDEEGTIPGYLGKEGEGEQRPDPRGH